MVLLGCGAGKKAGKTAEKLPGNWQAEPIAVDGDSKDWPSPYPNYDSKGKIAYATSNDGKYVYVTLETGDELTEVKVVKAGVTVSIDTSGGRDPQFRINYPLQNENDEMLDLPQPSKGNNTGHEQRQLTYQIKKMMSMDNQFSLEGFGTCSGGYSTSQNVPCGIKVRAAIDEYSELVWEAAIPVKMLYGKETLTAEDAGRPISICMTVNALKQPKKSSDPNSEPTMGTGSQNMNGGGMGMGGGRGRGAGGHGRTPTENPLEHLFSTTKTWKQFGLATK